MRRLLCLCGQSFAATVLVAAPAAAAAAHDDVVNGSD